MATDPFRKLGVGRSSPATRAFDVSPSDSADLPKVVRALFIGVEGDVKVTTAGGDTVTFAGVSGILPVAVRRVWSTGTDADSIVGLY
jgi:hypothetical protein